MSVLVPEVYYFDSSSFVVEFKIREHNAFNFVLLSQDFLGGIWGLLWPYTNFKIKHFLLKNAIGILIGIILDL